PLSSCSQFRAFRKNQHCSSILFALMHAAIVNHLLRRSTDSLLNANKRLVRYCASCDGTARPSYASSSAGRKPRLLIESALVSNKHCFTVAVVASHLHWVINW